VAGRNEKLQWKEVCNVLGNGLAAPWAEPTSSVKDMMSIFFGYLMDARTLEDVPINIHDL
jgi:hypothetical protein